MEQLQKLLHQYYEICNSTYDPSVVKKCVFCGKNPISKTKEHIIPQWLIEYTGDPDRLMNLLFMIRLVVQLKISVLLLINLFFERVIFVILVLARWRLMPRMLSSSSLRIEQSTFKVLLRYWIGLNKVRVGLCCIAIWDKSPIFIQPRFHISKRIGLHDRILYLASCKNL